MPKQRNKDSSLVIQAQDGQQTILPTGYSPPPRAQVPAIPAMGGKKLSQSEQKAMELLSEAMDEDGISGNRTRHLLALMALRCAFADPKNESEAKILRDRIGAIERAAKIAGAYGPLPPGQDRVASIEDMLEELEDMRRNAAITRG
ncbi:MAG: hypothetical protein AMXMBFR64_60710 [Myxococcales bacterium]